VYRPTFGRKRFALFYRTVVLSVLSVLCVCDVGVLCPNGWMDQDETWRGGRPRLQPHCVRWGPSFPTFRPMYCGHTAGWIKMSLGAGVGHCPGHIVLRVDPAPHQKGAQHPPIFGQCLLWPNGWMNQDATRRRRHFVRCS